MDNVESGSLHLRYQKAPRICRFNPSFIRNVAARDVTYSKQGYCKVFGALKVTLHARQIFAQYYAATFFHLSKINLFRLDQATLCATAGVGVNTIGFQLMFGMMMGTMKSMNAYVQRISSDYCEFHRDNNFIHFLSRFSAKLVKLL